MRYLLMFFTLLAGAAIPVQAVLNSRLGKQIGGSLMGSLISFLIGLICLFILNVMLNYNAITQLKPSTTSPWYLWLGGLLGAFFVGYITFVNQKQGLALTFALVVSGQLFLSLLIDHYGWFGSAIQPVSLSKLMGAALIIIGLILVKK